MNDLIEQKIINLCNIIPINKLANLINSGDTTFEHLIEGGLSPNRQLELNNVVRQQDNAAWALAMTQNTLESYNIYLNAFKAARHRDEANERIAVLDDTMWESVNQALSEQTLRNYHDTYPQGRHIEACDSLLFDKNWLKARLTHDLETYRQYMALHPGLHDEEIHTYIDDFTDDIDWKSACDNSDTEFYQNYLLLHPEGKYVDEARSKVDAAAGREAYIADLVNDLDSHGALDLQQSVRSNVITRPILESIYGPECTDAIMNYVLPAKLPEKTPPDQLQEGTTEVYFWGTPSSGKTCALGAIISSLRNKGIQTPVNGCSGYDYMVRLGNIFSSNGIVTFPDSTSVTNIQEMVMDLRDDRGRMHRLTLIDLAGELFRSAYFKRNNLFIEEENERTLYTALNYLSNKRNNKIHFFVVEYGAHLSEWDGLHMSDYLENMIGYLDAEKIMRKSTVGVYVIVTKCDKIPCAPEDRPRMAAEYVKEEMPNFWNTLQDACKHAAVKDLKILSFSVGQTFAQNFCYFDPSTTDKVIDKFLVKTHGGSKWDFFNK